MNKTDVLTKEEYETWIYCFARAYNDIWCARILMVNNQYTINRYDNVFFSKLIAGFTREAIILIDKATQYRVFNYKPNDRINEILELLSKEEYIKILRYDRNNILHYVEADDKKLSSQFNSLTPIVNSYSKEEKNLDIHAGVRYIWAENISFAHRLSKHNLDFNATTLPEIFSKYTDLLNQASTLILELCKLMVDTHYKT